MRKKKVNRKKYTKKGFISIVLRNTIAFIVGALYFTKEMIIEMLKAIIRFLIGATYLFRHTIKGINKMVGYLYKKLPKLVQTTIIYMLILGCAFNFVSAKAITSLKSQLDNAEQPVLIQFRNTDTETQVLTDFKDDVKDKTAKVCSNQIACTIYNNAVSKGLTHEQALIVVAISRHETGNWTSKAFNNKNNLGGIMCSSGLRTYNTLEDGIDAFTNLLANRYFGKGLNTIEQIGAIYCPVGASNDTTGVNKYWIPRVTQYYEEYLND